MSKCKILIIYKNNIYNDLSPLNISLYAPSQGTSVLTVRARDPDTGVNDQILYSIESQSIGNFILTLHFVKFFFSYFFITILSIVSKITYL